MDGAQARPRRVHVIASARSGIGKTLYARLLSAFLAETGETLLVFDTDAPAGDLAQFDEVARIGARVVDLARVEGQMALIDTLLVKPYGNAVVDLTKPAAQTFLSLGRELALFDPQRVDIAVVMHFLVDPSERGVALALDAQAAIGPSRFVAVENHHVVDPVNDRFAETYWQLEPFATVSIPNMPIVGNTLIAARECGFASFRRGEWSSGSLVLDHTMKRFIDLAFAQFERLDLKLALDDSSAFGGS